MMDLVFIYFLSFLFLFFIFIFLFILYLDKEYDMMSYMIPVIGWSHMSYVTCHTIM